MEVLLPMGMEWWQLPATVVALVLVGLVGGIVADWCYAFRARQDGSR